MNIVASRLKSHPIATSFAALMVAAGLIAGPGYDFFVTMFSGSQIGKVDLSRSSQPGKFNSVEFGLDPAMNPVGFVWSGHTQTDFTINLSVWNSYRASLYLGERQIMAREFSLSRGEKDSKAAQVWTSLGASNVPSAGRYRLVVEELVKAPISVSGMQIEFRRNVTMLNGTIVAAGFAAAFAGVALFFLIFWWPEVRAYFGRGNEGAHAAGNPVNDPGPRGATQLLATIHEKDEPGSRGAKILVIVFVLMMGALFLAKSKGYLP